MTLASICLCLLVLSAPAQAQENAWQKFVSRDQKFSFQYPAGWSVEESVSTVTIFQPSTGEELLVIALPFDRGKSPAELAAPILGALRGPMPDLQSSTTKADASTASFDLAYSRQNRPFSGSVFVVKGADQAMWFSYSAPASGYDRSRGVGLIRTLVSTLRGGSGTQPPAAAPSALPATPLIGDWSTSRSYGDVVNPVTGAYQRGSFSGELFSFRPDGGFRHVVMGSGVVISGVSIEDGQYTTNGNQLTLHVTAASWQPDPSHPGQRPAYKNQPRDQTQTYTLRFRDVRTLGLVASGSKLETLLYKQGK
ncbi:MAG: hypothetical protein ACLQGV_04395 [Bryobacteraceae bacterium]